MQKYNIAADLHCHTLSSTHAYSTLLEMVNGAKEKGLKAIAITDHAPAMDDAPHFWHFFNTNVWPRKMQDVIVLKGAEMNIVRHDGALDFDTQYIKLFEWVIASMHEPVYFPSTPENHLSAWLGVIKNPYVDALGHSGEERYACDYDKMVKACAEYGKIVEINNHSFFGRRNSAKSCTEIAKLCKKYEVTVCVDSDSHICDGVGEFSHALAMLEEIDFPERLILNTSAEKIASYIKNKRGIDILSD